MPAYAVTDGQSQKFTLSNPASTGGGDTVAASGTCSVDITVAGPTGPETASLVLAPNARVTAAFHGSGHAVLDVRGDATTSLILDGASEVGPINAAIGTDAAGTGTVEVGQGGQLDFARGVGSGVTVNLNGRDNGTAFLTLEQPGAFKGSVNFTDGFVRLGLAQAADYDLAGGVLTIHGGSGDAALAAVRFADNSPERAGLAVSLVNGSVTVAEAGTNAAANPAGTALPRHAASPTQPAVTPPVLVSDGATGQPVTTVTAQPYAGPVAGIAQQVIAVTAQSLNILATAPNLFIHTGSGTDAIQALSGTNVLDGGTGSNFLAAGTSAKSPAGDLRGTDTFFVDARGATADTWSTVAKFHAGDAATLRGVSAATPQQWADGQGAAGATGLTLHAGAAGSPKRAAFAAGPTASITLAGFSTADLKNGKVTASFGHDAASGSDYLYLRAG